MSKRTLDIVKIYTARDLKKLLESLTVDIDLVDIEAVDGRHLSRASTVEETLSDGSKVYNIILGFE